VLRRSNDRAERAHGSQKTHEPRLIGGVAEFAREAIAREVQRRLTEAEKSPQGIRPWFVSAADILCCPKLPRGAVCQRKSG